uniref:Lipase_3 domain-containing protein n=1 Tax=Syphacia muris TaxID=451379 RepID=A0A0N5AF63_9BILA
MLTALYLLVAAVTVCSAAVNETTGCTDYTDCSSCMQGVDKNNGSCDWCVSDKKCYGVLNACPTHLRVQEHFNCPRNNSVEYDEVFAKDIVLPLLAAAAAPNKTTWQECMDSNIVDAEMIKNYTVHCGFDRKATCFAYMAKIKSANAIAVSFRGPTDTKLDPYGGILVFSGKMSNVTELNTAVDSMYNTVFEKFWKQMRPDINDTLINSSPNEIWVVGHSYGGALASLLALVLSQSNIMDSSVMLKLVTFGEPRIGDVEYAELHDKLLPYSFRIINKNDIVPTLLLRKDPYVKSGPFHPRLEVWYPLGMGEDAEYRVAEMDEDGFASSSSINLSLIDHLFMFEKEISTWWKSKCKDESS